MKISKIFAAILLCLLVIAATSAYLAGRSRDAQEAAAIQEGTDVSGNSEDFAETEAAPKGRATLMPLKHRRRKLRKRSRQRNTAESCQSVTG